MAIKLFIVWNFLRHPFITNLQDLSLDKPRFHLSVLHSVVTSVNVCGDNSARTHSINTLALPYTWSRLVIELLLSEGPNMFVCFPV